VTVKIRLQRIGAKKRPFYRIVAVDSREKRDGAVIAQLGKHHPIMDGSQTEFNEESTLKWLKLGAQPTKTVLDLLKKENIWQKFKNLKISSGGGNAI